MSWSFKYVGTWNGICEAIAKGGGQYNDVTGRLEVPDDYKAVSAMIHNHMIRQTQAPEIGWEIEAWGGGPSFHVDIQPVNLRI